MTGSPSGNPQCRVKEAVTLSKREMILNGSHVRRSAEAEAALRIGVGNEKICTWKVRKVGGQIPHMSVKCYVNPGSSKFLNLHFLQDAIFRCRISYFL